MKTDITPADLMALARSPKTARPAQRLEPVKAFQPKTALKPDDMRAVFDETCARFPKTLARLAE